MDARAKSKDLFRAKLLAQKQEKQRIDSPLVRYNDHDQIICRVCDVVIKSEALWPAHQASRKHHAAVDQLKANSASRTNSAKPESVKDLQKPKPEQPGNLEQKNKHSAPLPSHQSSSLPPDFFDNNGTKRLKVETAVSGDSVPRGKDSLVRPNVSGNGDDRLAVPSKIVPTTDPELQSPKDHNHAMAGLEAAKQAKGALPEGFFDNKNADLRARGIVPVKRDAMDEYKEYEKLIQGDLQEIDNRLEEEEFDAAEMIEEEETVEQRAYQHRVELLRQRKLELRASKSDAAVVASKGSKATAKESTSEESSSDEEDDKNAKIAWRAKYL